MASKNPEISRAVIDYANACKDPANSRRIATARAALATARVADFIERTLADLPLGEHAVTVRLCVRRMFCDNARYEWRIFAERLAGVTAPWARRTARLTDRFAALGLALGGAAGAPWRCCPTVRRTRLRPGCACTPASG